MGRLGSYFVSQETETEVRTWTKHNPDGQSMWCHQTLIFLVCGQVEMNLHVKALHWEDGDLLSSFPFCTHVAWNTLKEITGVFSLAILFFL